MTADSTDQFVERMLALADSQASARVVLGIVGAPGAGKSTLAERLERGADARGRGAEVAVLPMDGFHLADVALTRLGRLDRKGAIDTFDGYGVLAMLRRIADERDNTVYAPAFERTLEQPIAGSIPIDPAARIVIVEGNYLLDVEEPWRGIRPLLTEAWFVETPDDVRVPRLIARHEQFGKSPADARAWVARVDEPNARRIAGGRGRADLVVAAAG
ncbi:nucleoside/nucleotide kinase family protein [Humibacter sp. RRB41]|uniref:nucleoside/nucleotide kinase family protein n=1 Tax=Humibacter sp. RRB41 TaxID=2919946 RepID=UPI001FAA271C|nr:nucleoside/nucleotide kinase family protein [Humibacter sp. RRB41]